MQSVVWNEAVKINGADPDFHRRDLWDAIQPGDFPEWELGVQLFDDDVRRPVRVRRARRHQADPRGARADPASSAGSCSTATVDNFFAETEQVAFCTQNIVPGIDFTNDPLLQGRNFSYLDTQLKRLGEPELHRTCRSTRRSARSPTSSRTGTWRSVNPVGRVNYEPNSWSGESGGPREDPEHGFQSFPAEEAGEKRRLRPESFADHYSQARQFFVSQTPVEQKHIARRVRVRAEQGRDASTSASAWSPTCATSTRTSPRRVADGLGLATLPEPLDAGTRRRSRTSPPSPALSILANAAGLVRRPQGRRAGHRRHRRRAPRRAARRRSTAEGAHARDRRPEDRRLHRRATARSSRPTRRSTAGRRCSTTRWSSCAGSPATGPLRDDAAAADFVTDAFAHCKFIGYVDDALPLLAAAGIGDRLDDGFVALDEDDARHDVRPDVSTTPLLAAGVARPRAVAICQMGTTSSGRTCENCGRDAGI